MKRKIIIFLLLCIAAVSLWGCRSQQRVLCRFVTRVDISCDYKGVPVRRHYTDTKKMEAVLLYLRLLRPSGPPVVDPNTVDGDIFQITVTLSDGQQNIYSQKAHRYFCKGSASWMNISPEQAAGLYEVMRHYESDI